jgi:hypothetical protein
MVEELIMLLPRRWVVERSFGWMARFRRLARDYKRPPGTLAGLSYLVFAIMMAKNFIHLMTHVLGKSITRSRQMQGDGEQA